MVRVCGEDILVEVQEVETVSAGGIIMALDIKKETATTEIGTVVALGPLAVVHVQSDDDSDRFLKAGDKIEFTKYAGKFVSTQIKEGKKFRLMMPDDIHIVID